MMGMVYGDGLCRFWIRRLERTLRTKVRIDPEMNTQAKYEKKRCRCDESESVPKAVKKTSITTSICILSYG